MNLILITMSDAKLHHLAISAKALVPAWGNLRKQAKHQQGGRSQNCLFRRRLTFAQLMLCHSQNRRMMRGQLV